MRKQQGLTQEQLAEKIGRTADAISQLERGVSFPNFQTLQRIAVALRTPVQEFLDAMPGSDDATSPRTERIAALVDLAHRMSDRDLETIIQVMDTIAAYSVRSPPKGPSAPDKPMARPVEPPPEAAKRSPSSKRKR